METANWVTLLAALFGVVMSVILFLVGRLLSANKDAVDQLRRSLCDQAVTNREAFRDLFGCIDSLRSKLGVVEVKVARLEGAREGADEHRDAAIG